MRELLRDGFWLTDIRHTDKPALLDHLNERAIYDMTLRIPFPYTEADADVFLAKAAASAHEQGRPVHWAIRNAGDYLIGAIGFADLHLGKTHRAEIGYWLAKPYWGQGIMTAAAAHACAITFGEFGLQKLTAEVFAANLASARVLAKCGFIQEGYLRNHFLKDGRLLDVRMFGLLRSG